MFSLRARLTVIILVPLIAIAFGVGYWQLKNAQRTAEEVFDRGLLTVALAVANDVAVSEGDALSPETARLLENSSGGPVFYHVYAPDGVIVAGYATPPVGIPRVEPQVARPQTFKAVYQGRPVSGVRLQTQTEIEGFSGIFTTTVWQDSRLREDFVRDLVLRTLMALGAILASVAVIVWFGVRLGLRPLNDLETAIKRRSSDDLSTIRRAVPEEVSGIVQTLNGLFAQVREAIDTQSQFIANAAHQLRNPIAGVLALAEAVDRAKTPEDRAMRVQDLLEATRKTADLTQRLLLHERARAISPEKSFALLEAQAVLEAWAAEFAAEIPEAVMFETDIGVGAATVMADALMLKEALSNLIDNALVHGGSALSRITLGAQVAGRELHLWVEDDGVGIPEEARETALTRFAQVADGEGSGLGLSIAQAIAHAHGGTFALMDGAVGLRAEMSLPTADV
ncbi:MAG: sensor histidine kinase [Paracoccaceae bacterium]|nr:sensor histidine kinase [Paracoccaceae bacterium]